MRTEELQRTSHLVHTHPEKESWPWLAAAFVLCPCHIPILLAILGTGALGGALARNLAVVVVALSVAFAFALWRYVGATKEQDTCERRQSRESAFGQE